LSSFDANGYEVKDGAQRTHQLRGLFTSQFGQADRSYLVGHSLGGMIVEDVAESFPSQYDGTLAMCGVMGGGRREIDYLANVRVLFDWFYKRDPAIIPGDFYNPPPLASINPTLAAAQNAVIQDGFVKLYTIQRFKQTPLEGSNPVEVLTSLLTALGNGMGLVGDVLARTHEHPFFDNTATNYEARDGMPLPPTLLAAVNDRTIGVTRYVGTPDAIGYVDRYYTPTGELQHPTITLHTTRDPFVPSVLHETAFANAVESQGASSLLVQRTVDRFGHCNFQTSEMVDALTTLDNWVESGTRP
jgi:pimeloyl-ACP methyl ester carboxylesterase